VYASSDGDSKVSVIDTATDTVVKAIEVGKSPHGLAMTPDRKILLAAVFGAGQVAFIDTASNTVTAVLPLTSPHNIAISPDGRTAYVAAQGKGALALVILDIPRMTRKGSVPLDKTPRALNFSPDGAKLYFTLAGSDSVQVLDTASNTVARKVPVGASPHHPIFAADGTTALVVSQGPGVLYAIDPFGDTVRANVKVGTLPHWIALAGDARTAYVTNEGSNDVTVVNVATLSVIATVSVGNAPRKIVIQPAGPASSMSRAGAVRTKISGFAFEETIRISTGQTVIWENADAVPHTVTTDTKAWSSGDIAPGKTFSMTFTTAGRYPYHCDIHPSMQATVIVEASM